MNVRDVFECVRSKTGGVGREYFAGFCGIAFEPFRGYFVSVLGSVGRFIGFFPVALASPESARLVVLPEGIVLCPYAVVEGDVFLSLCCAAAG
jgi:hypothetical protein